MTVDNDGVAGPWLVCHCEPSSLRGLLWGSRNYMAVDGGGAYPDRASSAGARRCCRRRLITHLRSSSAATEISRPRQTSLTVDSRTQQQIHHSSRNFFRDSSTHPSSLFRSKVPNISSSSLNIGPKFPRQVSLNSSSPSPTELIDETVLNPVGCSPRDGDISLSIGHRIHRLALPASKTAAAHGAPSCEYTQTRGANHSGLYKSCQSSTYHELCLERESGPVSCVLQAVGVHARQGRTLMCQCT